MEEITQPEKKDSIKEFIEKAAPHIKILLANWKMLAIINGIVILLSSAILLLFVDNYYDATIEIMPEYGNSSTMLGGLGGLAAIAGINVGEATPTEIYNNLIYSETVLSPVIYHKYKTEEFDDSVNLIEYFEIEPKTISEDDLFTLIERDKFLQVVDMFNKSIMTSSVDRITSIMKNTIRTKEPSLSTEICNNIVESLDKYIRTKRKSNAKEQRIYIEERVNQVKDSLTIVENQLKEFREQNRIVGQSPQLLLEQGRLQRSLEIQQTIYIELTKQLELIKLEEIKDVPVINVKEEAGIPIKKAGPRRSVYLLVIMVFSISVTSIIFLFKNNFIRYINTFKSIL